MMATWKLDPDHSTIMFSAKYLMFTTVTGFFKDFKADVETEGDDITEKPLIHFTAQVNSIDTNQPRRDKHLLSPDFFDAENYQQIRFEGTSMEQVNIIKNPFPIGPYQKSYHLEGNLTIRGITRAVTLKVEYQGQVTDNYHRLVSGFTLKGVISGSDFGVNRTEKTQAGRLIVGDEIRMQCSLLFVKD